MLKVMPPLSFNELTVRIHGRESHLQATCSIVEEASSLSEEVGAKVTQFATCFV